MLIESQCAALSVKNIGKYKDNVRKQLIRRMLYSYLHSSKKKKYRHIILHYLKGNNDEIF